jgi:hypothetical protein
VFFSTLLERFRLRRSTIAAVAGVGRAFVGREKFQRNGDEPADLIEGARTRGAQEGFQFGERELDRIEVRTIGREESHPRADLLDRGLHLRLLVDREVIEDNDVAGAQRGHQHLLDVREERRTIDGPIEHRRCAETLKTKRGDHGVGLPMAARGVIAEAGAARTAAVAPQQIGRHAAFIEKDILTRIVERLSLAPPPTVSRDVGPALFVGVYRFF